MLVTSRVVVKVIDTKEKGVGCLPGEAELKGFFDRGEHICL
jgi:hypothetical protein